MLKYIGTSKTSVLYSDPEYVSPSNYSIEIYQTYLIIGTKYTGEEIARVLFSSELLKSKALTENTWLLQYKNFFEIIIFENMTISKFSYNYRYVHVSEQYIYYNTYNTFVFLDFRNFKETIFNYSNNGREFTIYKKFLIIDNGSNFHVYVNDKDLPEGVTPDILDVIKNSKKKIKSSDKKILVHFNDKSENLEISYLKSYLSNYLNEQIENGDEIYISENFEDFHQENRNLLKFLNSDLLGKFYVEDILAQLTS